MLPAISCGSSGCGSLGGVDGVRFVLVVFMLVCLPAPHPHPVPPWLREIRQVL
jgi:hypothetical protein